MGGGNGKEAEAIVLVGIFSRFASRINCEARNGSLENEMSSIRSFADRETGYTGCRQSFSSSPDHGETQFRRSHARLIGGANEDLVSPGGELRFDPPGGHAVVVAKLVPKPACPSTTVAEAPSLRPAAFGNY